jgi:hypothetical protein
MLGFLHKTQLQESMQKKAVVYDRSGVLIMTLVFNSVYKINETKQILMRLFIG